jgi:hypothetical protein
MASKTLKQYLKRVLSMCLISIKNQRQNSPLLNAKASHNTTPMEWKEYPRTSVEEQHDLAAWPQPVVKAVVLTPLALLGGCISTLQTDC